MAARRALLRQRGGQSATALERAQLEKRVALLGTVGSNAPFVGLLGTVIGVIRAFEELGHDAAGSAGAGGSQVASQAVMSGIAEALVATAVGIAVALPAIAAYNYFQRRVTALLAEARHCRTWCSPISSRALLQLYRGHVYRKQRRAPPAEPLPRGATARPSRV